MSVVYSPSAHAASTAATPCSGFYFASDPNAPADAFPISDADHMTAINAPVGSVYSFSAPLQPTDELPFPVGTLILTLPTTAQIAAQQALTSWLAYKSQAQAALAESDKTILRCYENAVVVPAAWATYRKALRTIVGASSGTPGVLPTIPAYPAGT